MSRWLSHNGSSGEFDLNQALFYFVEEIRATWNVQTRLEEFEMPYSIHGDEFCISSYFLAGRDGPSTYLFGARSFGSLFGVLGSLGTQNFEKTHVRAHSVSRYSNLYDRSQILMLNARSVVGTQSQKIAHLEK